MDQTEMAWQIFAEAADPFCEELRKYHGLPMYGEAKKHGSGILKGLEEEMTGTR